MDLSKIIQYNLPENQYHKVSYPKKQIVLHHTASGKSVTADIDYWKSNPDKIATAFVLGRDGKKYQCFSSKYYAAHLGVPAAFLSRKGFKDYATRCDILHKESIGIELDNWGWLTEKGGKFYSWIGEVVPASDVITYEKGFKGYKHFERYTPGQISSLKELLIYLCDTYMIPKAYQADMWDISMKALSSNAGIYAHVSYRESGKWDVHPQPELIAMLKSLK